MSVFDSFEKKHDYLVCVDSDGCAMDTMNCKHFHCFGPCMVTEWALEQWEEEILHRWNDINLFQMTRGINRFKGLVMALLENSLNISMLVVMVQKEVALRFSAKPNKKDYGAITLSVDYYCDTEMVCDVPPHCFMPPPKVTSAVIKFVVRGEKKVSPKDEKLFFNVIKAAFGMRRKTLLNALSNSGCINLTKEEICTALEECSVDPGRRGETLDIFEFCALSDKIFEKIQKK